MRNRIARLAPVAALTLASAGLVSPMAAAVTAATLYASPTGSGTGCTTSAPCGLRTALSHAASGDSVVLAPGSYRTTATAYTQPLTDGGNDLDIRGAAGKALPVIHSKAQYAVDLTGTSTLSQVEVVTTGLYGVLGPNSDADHIAVISNSSDSGSVACAIYGVLADSLCVASGTNADAVEYLSSTSQSTTFTPSLRGDTLIASGGGGVALHADAGQHVTLNVAAVNSIVRGDAISAVAESTTPTSHVTVTLDHCDSGPTEVKNPKGTADLTTTNNVSDPPVFVNASVDDFREQASSPTVDAGANDPQSGTTDLAGLPRVLGKAEDIGAFELPQAPKLKKLKIHKVTKHAVHVTLKVNPRGLPTTVAVTLTGGHSGTGAGRPAGSDNTVRKLHLVIKPLHKHTKYKIHASATNDGGKTTLPKQVVHTK
jgi:hypothetical protein